TVGAIARAASQAAGKGGRTAPVPVEKARESMGAVADALVQDQVVETVSCDRIGWRPRLRGVVPNAPPAVPEWSSGARASRRPFPKRARSDILRRVHEVLFRLHLFGRDIPFYSYGFMMGWSFFCAAQLSMFLAEKEGIPRAKVVRFCIGVISCGLVGGRLH